MGLDFTNIKELESERNTKKLRRVPKTVANPNLDAIALLQHLQHASRTVEEIQDTEACYGTTSER